MRTILEELFYGNICPSTDCRKRDEETKQLMGYIADHHDKARFILDNKVGGYRCRSQVPEHEILKIVRMYEPIITEFFDTEEEMAKFQKWREEYEEKERLEKEEKSKKKAGAA